MRALPISVYFLSGRNSLPVAILGFSGVMVAFGIYLIAKLFIKGIDLKEIIAYFSLDFISVLFNLVFSVFASVGSTDIIDTFIVGNVLVLVANPILVYISVKKDKYISISSKVVNDTEEDSDFNSQEVPQEDTKGIVESTEETKKDSSMNVSKKKKKGKNNK